MGQVTIKLQMHGEDLITVEPPLCTCKCSHICGPHGPNGLLFKDCQCADCGSIVFKQHMEEHRKECTRARLKFCSQCISTITHEYELRDHRDKLFC